MRQTARFALRALLIVAVVMSLPALISPMAPAGSPSPYASALSGMVIGTVLAAPPSCGNTGCNRFGHCSKARGYNCDYSAGECQQLPC